MQCDGLAAASYDLYVLGLLDQAESSQIEEHIRQRCPACSRGLQRSMNLWVVFATTLEHAEPSEDFRARLVNVAELSKKVLTFPKIQSSSERTWIARRPQILIGGAAALLLIATAWYAGRESGRLEGQPASAELNRLTRQLAAAQVDLRSEQAARQALEKALRSSGNAEAANAAARMKQQLIEAQAEIGQYQAMMERQRTAAGTDSVLSAALESPHARLLSMKELQEAAASVAYAVIVENSRLFFIASNLPHLEQGKEYQLWLVRKEEPTMVSAGVFTPDDTNHASVQFDQSSLISEIVRLEVTLEPMGGSSAPTGPKLFESNRWED